MGKEHGMKKDFVARELTIEIVVGTFMIMVLLGLAYFTIILSSSTIFSKKYPVEVVFNHVMGLRDGDNIMVRGMPVGQVKSLHLQPDGVHVVASLDSPVDIREGYKISIVSSSMLGGHHVEIFMGDENGHSLPPDALFRGERPYDLMADAAKLVNDVKSGIVDGGVIENIQKASSDLQDLIERIKTGKGTLGHLFSEDDQLYEDIAASMSSLRSIADKLERGEGALGQLINDDALYEEIHGIAEEARAAMDDLRETSPIVTFTSVFFGAL
jgi:phospholipid/cholesterol/gamma-HCH transport system substrate-binding protein